MSSNEVVTLLLTEVHVQAYMCNYMSYMYMYNVHNYGINYLCCVFLHVHVYMYFLPASYRGSTHCYKLAPPMTPLPILSHLTRDSPLYTGHVLYHEEMSSSVYWNMGRVWSMRCHGNSSVPYMSRCVWILLNWVGNWFIMELWLVEGERREGERREEGREREYSQYYNYHY